MRFKSPSGYFEAPYSKKISFGCGNNGHIAAATVTWQRSGVPPEGSALQAQSIYRVAFDLTGVRVRVKARVSVSVSVKLTVNITLTQS
jgi:hypothetical protein